MDVVNDVQVLENIEVMHDYETNKKTRHKKYLISRLIDTMNIDKQLDEYDDKIKSILLKLLKHTSIFFSLINMYIYLIYILILYYITPHFFKSFIIISYK